jgi:hypothetical protein
LAAAAGGGLLIVSEFIDWRSGASAWQFFHGVDVALLVIGLLAIGLGVAALAGFGPSLPLPVGRTIAAFGVVATTVALIFVDTDSAEAGAILGLLSSLSILVGGLLLGDDRPGLHGRAPEPSAAAPGWYPDPRRVARLRYWDGVDWTERTSD